MAIPDRVPPRISPIVTNDIVFAGYIPFTESAKTKTNHTKTTSSGVILALDKETGQKLWEYNVNAAIAQVGPSIGNGMLFVQLIKSKYSLKTHLEEKGP